MKRKSMLAIIASTVLSFTFILMTTESYTKVAQPPTVNTGAPAETTCGKSGCHNTTPNTFTGTLNVSFNQPFYKPDSTYTVTVTTAETGMTRFGFEATVLDGSNNKQGIWSLINLNTTSLQTAANNRSYVGHKTANTTNSWTFDWQAPSTNVGDVTIYVASICANNNNGSSGDHCYTTSLVFQPNPFSSLSAINNSPDFLTVQNPVAEKMYVSFRNSAAGKIQLRLLDLSGKTISILKNENYNGGTHLQVFDKPAVAGMYLLELSFGNYNEVKKVVVL